MWQWAHAIFLRTPTIYIIIIEKLTRAGYHNIMEVQQNYIKGQPASALGQPALGLILRVDDNLAEAHCRVVCNPETCGHIVRPHALD